MVLGGLRRAAAGLWLPGPRCQPREVPAAPHTWEPGGGGTATATGRAFAVTDGRVLRVLEVDAAHRARTQLHRAQSNASLSRPSKPCTSTASPSASTRPATTTQLPNPTQMATEPRTAAGLFFFLNVSS